MRSRLHLLHHPLAPGPQPVGADGPRRRSGTPARRFRYRGDRADRRDLTAYGGDLPVTEPRPAGAPAVAAVPELERLRLSSLDPARSTPSCGGCLAGRKGLMPHLHLSLQAGDDLILSV